jgi:hypothetical protein
MSKVCPSAIRAEREFEHVVDRMDGMDKGRKLARAVKNGSARYAMNGGEDRRRRTDFREEKTVVLEAGF